MLLILRSRPSDALKQVETMRSRAPFDLTPEDVQCPTIRIERRVGRDRRKVEMDVPVLGNFIFLRWDGNLYFANWVERTYPFVKIMRLPHGGYATCTEKEVEAVSKWALPPAPTPDSPEWIDLTFEEGDEVEVKKGTFLGPVKGIVQKVKKSGEVKLKVTEDGGLKLTTLLIHGSLLTISVQPL